MHDTWIYSNLCLSSEKVATSCSYHLLSHQQVGIFDAAAIGTPISQPSVILMLTELICCRY
jgi:hypothetical protein